MIEKVQEKTWYRKGNKNRLEGKQAGVSVLEDARDPILQSVLTSEDRLNDTPQAKEGDREVETLTPKNGVDG